MTYPRLAALLIVASAGCSVSVPPSSTQPRSLHDGAAPGEAADAGEVADADGPVACGAATLVERPEYRALSGPLAGTVVFAADFDGDGHEDLLVTGLGTRLLRSDGRGGYGQAEEVSEASTLSLAPIDFDADGRPDLVVREQSGMGYLVSILINDGTGHFGHSFPLGTWTEPLAAVAADLDGDGRQDVVVSEWDEEAVKVHLLRQLPGFLFDTITVASVPSKFYFSRALGAGDLDGDGDPDVVVGFDNGIFDTGLSIAWNDRGAVTVDPTPLPSNGWPILVVDLDRDGRLDIVDSLRVFRGLGARRFEKHALSTSYGPVTAADLDGDGALDLIVRESTDLAVHRQMANLTWKTSRWPAPGTPTFFSAGPIATAVTDVGEDGKKDVVFSDTGALVQVLEAPASRGPSTRRLPLVVEGRPFTQTAAGADFDGDGQTDVVQFNYGNLVVLTNRRGTLVEDAVLEIRAQPGFQVPSGDYVSDGIVADLDGDGRLDLAAVTKGGWLVTFFNRGRGVWERGHDTAVSQAPVPGRETVALAAGDFDGDGDVDLASAQHSQDHTDAISLFWNDSHGQFGASETLPFPDEALRSVAAADLNGDGRPEVLVGSDRSTATPRVHVYQARAGSIEERSTLDVDDAAGMQKVFPADLDGDGATDLVVSLWGGQRVLWNDGHGGFAVRTRLEVCPSPLVRALAVGDIDNDGHRDLAMACDLDAEVGLQLGDGKRGFTPAPPLYTDDEPEGLVAADLDGRCGTDLVVANGSLSGELWVYLNGPPR